MIPGTRDLNRALKLIRKAVRLLPEGEARTQMQERFDRILTRIGEVTGRVMVMYDAGTIANDAELDDVYVAELLLALDAWELGG